MSKFKPGDNVYYVVNSLVNNDGWRYKVILAGLLNNEGVPAVLIEYTATPKGREEYIGRHWVCDELALVKAPKTHKVTLVTYSPFHDSDKVTSYVDKDFTTPEAWKKECPLHALRDYRLIEIELPE